MASSKKTAKKTHGAVKLPSPNESTLFSPYRLCISAVCIATVAILVPIVFAAIVSNSILHPPWYKPVGESGTLFKVREDSNAGTKLYRDPLTDMQVAYTNVSFEVVHGADSHSGEEEVTVTLRGWFIPAVKEAAPGLVFVMVHGGGADRREFMRQAIALHEKGYASLLFDLTSHGRSDALFKGGLRYGFAEDEDVIAAVTFVRDEFNAKKVVVMGTSMGGATAIKAAARHPKHIDALILENPFANAERVWRYAINRTLNGGSVGGSRAKNFGLFHRFVADYLVLPDFMFDLTAWLTMWRINAHGDTHPEDDIGDIEQPVLLMHSKNDILVPFQHSLDLKERFHEDHMHNKEVWIVDDPKSGHCLLFNARSDEYIEKIISFVNKHVL